jgi:hypothetical protein
MGADPLAACFVRGRVVAGDANGRIMFVRVGWLTSDLAGTFADEFRNAPAGTWVELRVPEDLADTALDALRTWLRRLVGPQVRVAVKRSADVSAGLVGPCASPDRDTLPQDELETALPMPDRTGPGVGTDLADTTEQQPPCCHRRRSDE